MPNCFRVVSRKCASGFVALFFLTGTNAFGDTIGTAWDSVLENSSLQTSPDPILTAPQTSYEASPVGDFQEHFFANTRTDYLRTQTYFTGLPTLTNVINGPPSPVFNPAGIPYQPAFQSGTNEIHNFMNWGTNGWLSDRVNSNFSFAYAQDLTHVADASPQLDILNTTGSDRRLRLLSGYVDINGRPTDGVFAGTSLQLGRQYVYGAELAQMDGASFSVNRPRFSWTLFGGRRFTFYSDPQQRGIGGGNFLFRFSDTATFEYDALYYIKGTNFFRYRQTIGSEWLLSASFRMVGGAPTDVTADVLWNPGDGKTSLRVGFDRKLTDKDYFYDYTYNERDNDPYNTLQRLNLGALEPYTQFVVDFSRAVDKKLRLGGTVFVRQLVDTAQSGPFDTSFQDVRANAQFLPRDKIEVFAGYHVRFSDNRTSTVTPTQFDDLSTTGETEVQDVSVEIGRSYMNGRLHFKAGGFYRQLNFRDQFAVITDARDKGVIGDAYFKVDNRTRLFMNYGLDTDYAVFRPDIQNSQTFRFGLAWSY
jgi:hypothetical protein